MPTSTVPRDELPEFGFLIYDISRLMRAVVQEKLIQVDLTEAQWRAVAHLSKMEGCRQAELAQTLQIRPITLARVIDKLEAANMVHRQQHEDDRRSFSLYLTKQAKPLVETLENLRKELHELAMTAIDQGDRETLMDQLKLIKKNLSDPSAAKRISDITDL